MDHLKEYGSCDHQVIRERYGQHDMKEYLNELRTYFDQYQAYLRNSKNDRDKSSPKTIASSLRCKLVSWGIDQVITPKISELITFLNQENPLGYLDDLFMAICKEYTLKVENFPEMKITAHSDLDRKSSAEGQFKNKISEQLSNKNPQPVGIVYCEDVLWHEDFTGVTNGSINSSCSVYHVSVVIGQRFSNEGKHQFLVRNSWGSSCNQYTNWDCERGQIWVDADKLAKNLTHG